MISYYCWREFWEKEGSAHTHALPAVCHSSIIQGVVPLKNWPSKMDLFLNFMLKTFEIQTFFGYNPSLGSSLAHIKKYFDSFIVYYAKQFILTGFGCSFHQLSLITTLQMSTNLGQIQHEMSRTLVNATWLPKGEGKRKYRESGAT